MFKAVAGIAYTTAWVVGLAVWPSNLDVAAANVKVVATYSALLLVWVTGTGVALARNGLFKDQQIAAFALTDHGTARASR